MVLNEKIDVMINDNRNVRKRTAGTNTSFCVKKDIQPRLSSRSLPCKARGKENDEGTLLMPKIVCNFDYSEDESEEIPFKYSLM